MCEELENIQNVLKAIKTQVTKLKYKSTSFMTAGGSKGPKLTLRITLIWFKASLFNIPFLPKCATSSLHYTEEDKKPMQPF